MRTKYVHVHVHVWCTVIQRHDTSAAASYLQLQQRPLLFSRAPLVTQLRILALGVRQLPQYALVYVTAALSRRLRAHTLLARARQTALVVVALTQQLLLKPRLR